MDRKNSQKLITVFRKIIHLVLFFWLITFMGMAHSQSGSLEGVFSLPNDEIAEGDIGVTVAICTYDVSNSLSDCFKKTVIIADGENSAAYLIEYLLVPDGSYQVYGYCWYNCSPYLGIGLDANAYQYLQNDGSIAPNYNRVNSVPSNVNFTLIEAAVVSGTISLPNGEVATKNIGSTVRICLYTELDDALDGFLGCMRETVTIPSGENSASYRLEYLEAPSGASYRAYIYCDENCSPYLKVQQYLQADNSVSPGVAQVNSVPSTMDATLIEATTMTGNVSLPNNEMATGDIRSFIQICSYGASDELLHCTNGEAIIPDGQNSVAYSLEYLTAPTGGSYSLYAYCTNNCSPYMDIFQYLQPDGSVKSERVAIGAVTEIPNSVDIMLTKGELLTGTINLPNGETASGDIETEVLICRYASGFVQGCFDQTVTIPEGESSATYELSYIPISQGGSYQLFNRCSNNCSPYLRMPQSLQEDGSVSFKNAFVDSIPASVNFSLVQGQAFLEGSISLPDGDIAVTDISNYVAVCIRNEFGVFIGCASDDDALEIKEGASSVNYRFPYMVPPIGGSFEVWSYCTSCSPYSNELQYLQDDGSILFKENSIPASSMVPNTLDFILSEVPDHDSDGVNDSDDNCPFISNANQTNYDGDMQGDVCDLDDDNDTINDSVDNCQFAANLDQEDLDKDQLGDVCDDDADGDNVLVGDDSDDFNAFVCSDVDNDLCDDCSSGLFDVSRDGKDTDKDGMCNIGDNDDDNDGVNDVIDNCPIDANFDQKDSNNDGVGDVCSELCFPIKASTGVVAMVCL